MKLFIQKKSGYLKPGSVVATLLAIAFLSSGLHAQIDEESVSTNEMVAAGSTTNVDEAIYKTPRDYIRHAQSREAFHDYIGARQALDMAIKLNPNLPAAYGYRSEVNHKLGYDDEAFADCTKVIELNPRLARGYNMRGIIEMDSFQDFKGAMADFNRAIILAPKAPQSYINRAWVKRRLKNPEGAIQDLDRASEISPGSASVYALRGCILDDLTNYQGALDNFCNAVEINPTDEKSQIRIWLIRVRLGERGDATAELIKHTKSLPKAYLTRWPVPVERFLIGTLPEEEVFKIAKTAPASPWVKREPLCEADYYVGMEYLLSGDRTRAANYFRSALDTYIPGYSEYESAAVELKALGK